jgi:RNA polymerase sigma factor (sigma-70 family)
MQNTPVTTAFLELIQQNKRIIFKICHAYCKDRGEHEDLAQEIVYELWRSFGKYDPGFRFSTWLYRIALNVAISYYRKTEKQKHIIPFPGHLIELAEEKEDEATTNRFALLRDFIQSLNEIDRSIMMLYLDDHAHREIAAIIGTSESNVATRIGRIKDKMRTKFSNPTKQDHGTE